MRYVMLLGLAGMALATAACNRQPTYYGQNGPGTAMDPCDSSRNPLECRGYRDAGGNVNEYLQYGLLGMMAQRSYYNGQPQIIYVRDPGYHGSFHPSGHFYDQRYQQTHWQQNKIANQRAEINRLRAQRDTARTANSSYSGSTSTPAPRPSAAGGNSRTVPSTPSPSYYHTSPPRPAAPSTSYYHTSPPRPSTTRSSFSKR